MAAGEEHVWCSSWSAAPQDWNEPIPLPGYDQPVPSWYVNQTIRQLVRPCIGGAALRVRLSNVVGRESVSIAAASIGRSSGNGAVFPGTLQTLTFDGAAGVTIPAGEEAWSDVLVAPVEGHVDLALSLYFQSNTSFGTVHRSAFRTGWIIDGNAVNVATPTAVAEMTRTQWVAGVDVLADGPHAVVVAFGDSLTDGTGSTVDARRRYPDRLADRLAGHPVSVVNAGIAGNRMLHDRLGPNGLSRFKRDVLGQTGITHTILLQGINDIGFSLFSGPPLDFFPAEERIGSAELISGLQTMIDLAHAQNVKVLLGTLLPFKGARYHNEAQESHRAELNRWIRSSEGRVHAVIDFDAALRCSDDPLALNAAYDSGDHLHPNDSGFAAMAAVVPLEALK
jgi:lysophospholipase L1-like esterase